MWGIFRPGLCQVFSDKALYKAALAFSAYGILFCLLTGVYVADSLVSVGVEPAERLLGLVHTVTGLWLMYLVFATVLNISSGYDLPAA